MKYAKQENFVGVLLLWAKHNLRDFPWRKTKDAYRILVAETMLQRTRGEQVIPIYEEFIRRYPTPRALARAPLEDVERCIESLGLARAR